MCLLDIRLILEDDTEVIFQRTELLVCHLDHSVGEKINLVLFEKWMVLLGRVVEESSFDLGSIIVN